MSTLKTSSMAVPVALSCLNTHVSPPAQLGASFQAMLAIIGLALEGLAAVERNGKRALLILT